ncbi:MAG: lycopene beta-cyclase CrtY, partial [Myxococcota bacterium]
MSSQSNMPEFDYVLVGGGLQNGLLALALLHHQPECRIALVERGPVLGGNHTWCFHSDDVPDSARAFVEPLVAHRWPGYVVRFPDLARQLDTPYAAVTSARLDQVVSARMSEQSGCAVLLDTTATEIGRTEVTLADGRQLRGRLVVDARGPAASRWAGPAAGAARTCGYQKFVGHELRLDRPHGLDRPILMDATVAQTDEGYRFIYTLPLAEDRVLVEETYFSDTPDLAVGRLRRSIADYAADLGLAVAEVIREESGVLPIPWDGAVAEIEDTTADRPLAAGIQGGWFHPVTGYSFPIAVRLAECLAST